MTNIHSNIKVLRTEARLSQEEFAEKLGVDVETVKLWEKGKLDPTDREIELMCPILRIHKEDFLERDIEAERNDAGRRMKQKGTRDTYNWYYGKKTTMAFYISYLIILPIVAIMTYIVTGNILEEVFKALEVEDASNYALMYQIGYTYISCGLVSSIYVTIYLFKNGIIRFRYWYIFIISTLISIMVVVCGIATIGLYPYAFYKGVIKKGKVR